MKPQSNKKLGTVLLGSIIAAGAAIVVDLMISGHLQDVVRFRGAGEEILFTFFAALVGIGALAMSITCLLDRNS